MPFSPVLLLVVWDLVVGAQVPFPELSFLKHFRNIPVPCAYVESSTVVHEDRRLVDQVHQFTGSDSCGNVHQS
ncbi:hypothetical protein C5167_033754 [Papaver somniferum]|uniref:Secreted protein n=1 Tax=Papaver somniferum TaxID=3469 RepID=A0A4Y7KE18_PAPSO|nr:hypothetical protein C5167_033754 [Papaver somniferum]